MTTAFSMFNLLFFLFQIPVHVAVINIGEQNKSALTQVFFSIVDRT